MSHSRASEEMLSLLDEKTLSDLESDSDRAATERRFPTRPWSKALALCCRSMRPSSLPYRAARLGFELLPSFIQPLFTRERLKPEKLRSTAYLDGMRGLAALFVFFCHYSYTCFIITYGYGLENRGNGDNNNFLQLPIIRLLYSGPPMVCLFFVISGYALSLKPLKQMRTRAWGDLTGTVSSSIFRRPLRLFLPTTISTFMVFVMLRMGLYENTRKFSSDHMFLQNVQEHHPKVMLSFTAQLKDWIWQMFNFACIFSWKPFAGSTGYDVHLWTIPVEFRASMLLFLTIIALARLRPWLRLTILFGLSLFVLRNDRWEMMLFYSGMFIAELDLIRQSPSGPSGFSSRSLSFLPMPALPRKSKLARPFWFVAGIVALYLMSQPDDFSEKTPGWIWLYSLIPDWFSEKYRYWQCIGSILFIVAAARQPLLQAPFNTRVVQYFGKISYSLYLVHGPVMHVLGYLIMPLAWKITGHATRAQYISGFFLGAAINMPLIIWAADLFWRFMDAPSVKFARNLENWFLEKDPAAGKELPL
jgi:peptidoglycan/LPS O-acetylase OafA/YrhL